GTMAITTILFYLIARDRWHWSRARAAAIAGGFLAVDWRFYHPNMLRTERGGWEPSAIAGGGFLFVDTWIRGVRRLTCELAGALEAGARRHATRQVLGRDSARQAGAGAGHRCLSDARHQHGASRAPAPLSSRQGVARARRAAVRPRGGSAGGGRPDPRAERH